MGWRGSSGSLEQGGCGKEREAGREDEEVGEAGVCKGERNMRVEDGA